MDWTREEFAAAVNAHSRAMYRAARSVLDCGADAEDAVSQAVLQAWQSLDKLREDEVPLGELGVEQEPSAESVLLLWADNQEKAVQKARLTAMLSELNEEEKGLIQALFFEGVSAREYARRLGVYHRTVIYRRDKLLEKLRRKIFS